MLHIIFGYCRLRLEFSFLNYLDFFTTVSRSLSHLFSFSSYSILDSCISFIAFLITCSFFLLFLLYLCLSISLSHSSSFSFSSLLFYSFFFSPFFKSSLSSCLPSFISSFVSSFLPSFLYSSIKQTGSYVPIRGLFFSTLPSSLK